MIHKCPNCKTIDELSGCWSKARRAGRFKRKSDSRWIQKFQCLACLKYFSTATSNRRFGQNKRQFNSKVLKLFCSGVSQRRSARILGLDRKTVVRKLVFLGEIAESTLEKTNSEKPRAKIVEFDDMETIEHTKLKPLSITLAVEHKSRRILGFEVSQMPAKGFLARKSIKKYGVRKDERSPGRQRLFKTIAPLVEEGGVIKSDENPHYVNDVKKYFPKSFHERHKGQRGSIGGQGELKKIRFDPLFSLNHTCAMFRANVNRLFRKTWCTTKSPKMLRHHLAIYAVYHNLTLLPQGP